MKRAPSANQSPQAALVTALADPTRFPHPATAIERLETHISHIILAGDYAYKIKKPLNLGFLDFTSLERRKYYCEEELRLNRRLAPDLYLDCIPICGSAENPELGGEATEAIEYAVKMTRFPQETLLDRRLKAHALKRRHMDALARQLAAFHAAIARAGPDTPFGSPCRVFHPAVENFEQIRSLGDRHDDRIRDQLAALQTWTEHAGEDLRAALEARKARGFIRECHGDLHLGNIILRGERITIFDCIEFSEELRWIDVMSDLAFLIMDLYRRGAAALARRLLNTYLEFAGDYPGLTVLTYYLVYRAMVRAKIAAIRRAQPDLEPPERRSLQAECRAYLDLAQRFIARPAPFLLITHGVSGSGKSHITARLLESMDAIRIRSDVERKRLHGLGPLEASASALHQGLYTAETGARTYDRLRALARQILDAGYPVLVDATFLDRQRRQSFRDLAGQRGVPFVLLACTAERHTLRERVAERARRGVDAAEADVGVLEDQLRDYVPPLAEEDALLVRDGDIDAVRAAIQVRTGPAARA